MGKVTTLGRVRSAVMWMVLVALAMGASAQDDAGRPSFVVRVHEFDRANVALYVTGMSYADTEPVLVNAGTTPNRAEYDIEFPVTARYEIHAKYTAVESRPVDILVDGAQVVRGFASTTGSWQASQAIWEKQCEVDLEAGAHTITLECPGPCFPHIAALRFVSDKPFPDGWKRTPKKLDPLAHVKWSGQPNEGEVGYAAYVREDGFVDAPTDYDPIIPYRHIPPPNPMGERALEYLLMGEGRYQVEAEMIRGEEDAAWLAKLSVQVSEGRTDTAVLPLDPERVRKMLEHTRFLIRDFRELTRQPGSDDSESFLAEENDSAAALLRELRAPDGKPEDEAWAEALYGLYVRAYTLKNRVALSNPLIDFDRLLFAKRQTYDTSHIYTTYFDGSHRYGGNLHLLSPIRPDGETPELVSGLPGPAIYRDPDLSWDGRRVLFSYKPDMPTPCRIYEISVDGTGLRQLTDTEYDDIDPCYLPDGRIMFVSTRCRRVVLCHNAFTVSVLHTMDADGGDVRCVSSNTVNDFTPSVLADGTVAYTKWEYVDKQLGNNQSLWGVNPDGASPRHFAGEHWGPITLWEPRQVPGSNLIVTTLAPHMPIAVGPIALIDPADACASPAVFENITEELPPPHHFGWARTDVGYYCSPFPLSEDYHIVSYNYSGDDRAPAGYGLYLLDRWNNRDLIYRDPDISCFEAFPVEPRERPPVIPASTLGGGDEATLYVLNVYDGLDGVVPGSIKHLRVVREIPKPVSAECGGHRLQYPVISHSGHLAVKELLGTVPVEEDGSAYFRVPADEAVYFSALDENYMEVQRMRSFTELRAGERVTCVGCHEHRTTAPANAVTLAGAREPSAITPPPGGPLAPSFAHDVQPILDRHCIQCHSAADPQGGLSLAGTPTDLFNVAYESLITKGLVSYVDANDSSTLPLRPAKYYGSHASRMVEVLRTTHAESLQLDAGEFRELVTWIDLNAPYYGTYTYTRPGTVGGRGLLTPTVQAALRSAYDQSCASCHGENVAVAHRVDFGDVERSPALLAPLAKAAGGTEACGEAVFASKDAPEAQPLMDALRLLQREIAENPRVDMVPRRPPLFDEDMRYVYRP